jgi:RHS repeat-associated protein
LIPIVASATDSVTVGFVNTAENIVDVPVYIRDISGNALGRDQAEGSKIQSFSIKVFYSPADAVSSVAFTRAGITSSLAPSAAFNPAATGSISLVDTFQESSNLIPLTLDAAAPGDLVAHLIFTLRASTDLVPAIAIWLDPSRTLLSDEGGNTSESAANGKLVLVNGGINIPFRTLTTPSASLASTLAETGSSAIKAQASPRPARFLSDAGRATRSTHFSPRTTSYTGTTNHDAAFTYDDAGDVLHDDTGRSFTYDALSMTTGATVTLSNGGTRNFAYLYTADDERIALVEKLSGGATTTNWTLRGLDNHLLRTWTNSTSGWSWREDEIWRGASLLAYESASGVRHYGLDHLGSPAILTDAGGHPIGTVTFDAFGNGGAIGAGMLQYTGHERDSVNVGSSPGSVALPDYLHARYYDSVRGRFLSVDPNGSQIALSNPQRWNRFTYALNSPLGFVDLDGRDVLALGFINYRAKAFGVHLPFTGHAALITIDSQGRTRMYEYGRYDHPNDKGIVRQVTVPDLVMKDGKPTDASLKNLLISVSAHEHDYKGTIEGAYFKASADKTNASNQYATGRMAQNSDQSRASYNTGIVGTANNCGTFTRDGVAVAGGDTTAAQNDIRPESILDDLMKTADEKIIFDAATQAMQVSPP